MTPDLLAAVDVHVAAYPELDRSAVLDQALRLWRAYGRARLQAQVDDPDAAG